MEKPQISDIAKREEEVLSFWKEQRIFEKSLEKHASNGEFVFDDGPPFATGLPHIGHLLASSIKDAIGRYKTMRGYHVRRVWGWDCHGLPIETKVEEKLELKTKKDIEKIGVAKFNSEARKLVLAFVDDWKQYIERIGRWVDFDDSYKTMDTGYMESVWWALKTIYDKGDLYEGNRVLMYCPHCETPLAKAEIAMDNSYKDITDEAVTIAFRAKTLPHTSFLAWTTTPWTLPGNVALAVNPNMVYVTIEKKEESPDVSERFIVAKERLAEVFNENEYTIVDEKTGNELIGLSYEPLYPPEITTESASEKPKFEKAFHIYGADYVTSEDGTGIVHIASMYGEEDNELGKCEGLPMVQMLRTNGTYNDEAPKQFRGLYLKDAERDIKKDLEERGVLFARANHTHSYPHCYRCGTPLIYNAVPSWFINIQRHKERMLELNKEINWVPEHLKEGRFHNILESAPDWTISRNRYWATPLPIWRGVQSGKKIVVGSVRDLVAHAKTGKNTYVAIRHGESKSNTTNTTSTSAKSASVDRLTDTGRAQVLESAQILAKEEPFDFIFVSPFARTRETARILTKELGVPDTRVILEDRLREIEVGVFDEKPLEGYDNFFASFEERFTKAPQGGETLNDIRHRAGALLYELETRYKGKRILLVSHSRTIWALRAVAKGLSKELATKTLGTKNAEITSLNFALLPHNEDYELDLHRPYIDDIELVDEKGEKYRRVSEVVDCWVESGAMPFAELHAPMENEQLFAQRSPADFIAEYIAQTRTWFYYLHAISTILFDRPAFKNVVTTGTVLASDGEKMSKSKGNFTDPMENINRYGADAMRLYMLGSVVMQSEDLAFKDEDIRELYNRVVMLFSNSAKFYTLFADDTEPKTPKSITGNVLDRWIRARVYETTKNVTDALDAYETPRAMREIRPLIEDLSQWYVRRSRDRIRTGSRLERTESLETLRETLRSIALLLAPFAPFIAEEVFQTVKTDTDPESVHLASWSEEKKSYLMRVVKSLISDDDEELVAGMAKVRSLASEALMLRQKAGIKVRQPLATLSVPDALSGELADVLAEEVNVKKVKTRALKLELDTSLTETLRREGDVREFARAIAGARKTLGFSPKDTVSVSVTDSAKDLLEKEKLAGVTSINFAETINDAHTVKLSFGEIGFSLVRNAT